MNFKWIMKIQDIEAHIKKITSSDDSVYLLFEILTKHNGIEAFIKIYEQWNKSTLRFPFRHIMELKKIYVLQNLSDSTRNLAHFLDVDESTIARWRREFKGTAKKTYSKKDILNELLE